MPLAPDIPDRIEGVLLDTAVGDARRLRFWLLGAPAGAGPATLKSIGRLWLSLIPRNALFLAVVLVHRFRRIFPPY